MRNALALPVFDSENFNGKTIDNAHGKVDRVLEGWKNRITLKNLALTERYLKFEARLCVVFRLKKTRR